MIRIKLVIYNIIHISICSLRSSIFLFLFCLSLNCASFFVPFQFQPIKNQMQLFNGDKYLSCLYTDIIFLTFLWSLTKENYPLSLSSALALFLLFFLGREKLSFNQQKEEEYKNSSNNASSHTNSHHHLNLHS